MKPQIGSQRRQVRWKDGFYVLVAAGVWGALLELRPYTISTICATNPASCNIDEVFPLDRIAAHLSSARADAWSFSTQDWAGIAALTIPMLWVVYQGFRKKKLLPSVARGLGDWMILVQCTFFNGATLEAIRALVQRPRPFVLDNPRILGTDPAHYTSMYSGHASFAALAGMTLVLTLRAREAPRWLVVLSALFAIALAVATGVFRVEAGRHYPTDVIAGALIGAAIAVWVARIHSIGPPLQAAPSQL